MKKNDKTKTNNTKNKPPVNNIMKLIETLDTSKTPYELSAPTGGTEGVYRIYYPNKMDPIYIVDGLYRISDTESDTEYLQITSEYKQSDSDHAKVMVYKTVNSVFNIILEHYQNKIKYILEIDFPNTKMFLLKEYIESNKYECEYDFKNMKCILYIPSKEKFIIEVSGPMSTNGIYAKRSIIIHHRNEEIKDFEIKHYDYIEPEILSCIDVLLKNTKKDFNFKDVLNEIKEKYKNNLTENNPDESMNEIETGVNLFIKNECIFNKDMFTPTSELYNSYVDYCHDNKITKIIRNKNGFSRMINNLFDIESSKRRIAKYSHPVNGYYGIYIKPDSKYISTPREKKIYKEIHMNGVNELVKTTISDNLITRFDERGNAIYKRNGSKVVVKEYNKNNYIIFRSIMDISTNYVVEERYFYDRFNKLILFISSDGTIYETQHGLTVDKEGNQIDFV